MSGRRMNSKEWDTAFDIEKARSNQHYSRPNIQPALVEAHGAIDPAGSFFGYIHSSSKCGWRIGAW